MDPETGFGFFCEEITNFEQAFADYCGTNYAVSITNAGAGLDLVVMALDLEPGDEVIVPAINFKAAHYAVIGQGGAFPRPSLWSVTPGFFSPYPF